MKHLKKAERCISGNIKDDDNSPNALNDKT